MTLKILLRNIAQFRSNWLDSIRIGWLWFAFFAFTSMLGSQGLFENEGIPTLLRFALSLIFLVVSFVGWAAIGLAWHRHILRDDAVGAVYLFKSGWPNGAYLWRSVKLAAFNFVVLIPLAAILYFVLLSVFSSSETAQHVVQALSTLTLVTFLVWLNFRLGLILPATAVGQSMTLRQSYQITNQLHQPILAISLGLSILVSADALVDRFAVLEPVEGLGGLVITIISGLFGFVFDWIATFLGIGMLTVLYGYLVEERPL